MREAAKTRGRQRRELAALRARVTELERVEAERDRVERQLRESERKYRLLVNHIPDVTWVSDRNGNTVFISPNVKSVYGYTPEEIYASGDELWFGRISPDDVEKVRHAYEALFSSEASFDIEYRIQHKDGHWIWLHDRALMHYEKDEAEYAYGVFRDVTERKHAEEERRRLQAQILQAQKFESLGVLAGGIAHDFNNILVGILGNSSLVLDQLAENSPLRQNVEDIEGAAARAADLCRQMLAYAGRGRFVIEHVDLNEVIQEMARFLAVSISKDIVFKYDLATDLPFVKVDSTQIRQLIMNLLTNAVEAIGQGVGVITISTGVVDSDSPHLREPSEDGRLGAPVGKRVFIEVVDTGCGMDEGTLARLFDPFFSTKFTGRGLGLSVVLGIVRGHDAVIQVDSKPGRGTRFRVAFPAVDVCPDRAKQKTVGGEDWRGSGTILLADDEEVVLVVASRMLKQLGFEVLTAHDGLEALELFRERHEEIACVMLDLTMPRMGGRDAFRELRRIRGDTPILISSGFDREEVSRSFSEESGAGLIQKPYRLAALRDALRGFWKAEG